MLIMMEGKTKMIDYNLLPNHKMICVDMKSFYASCSCVMLGLDPLKTHLAVVGGLNHPGSVVLASSPAMKSDFKIKTGNRRFEIPDDPRIILVEPKMGAYLAISSQINRIFNRYAPKSQIHVYSVDESFVNLDGSENLYGTVEDAAVAIRDDMLREFGLTCCIGIGPNMLMAKVCLDVEAKKTGIAHWTYDDVKTKLWAISPLREMWGIGSQTEIKLNGLGIYTIGDLARYSRNDLEKRLGVMGNQLWYHAWGVDYSEVGASVTPKSHGIGQGQTLMRDYYDSNEIKTLILEMCENIAKKARTYNYVTRTISLGLMFSRKVEKKSFSHAKTIANPTNVTMDIYQVCVELLEKYYEIGTPVRKIQIRISNLEKDDGMTQLELFEEFDPKRKKVGFVMDSIKNRMGNNTIKRAVSLTKASTLVERNKMIGGHKA